MQCFAEVQPVQPVGHADEIWVRFNERAKQTVASRVSRVRAVREVLLSRAGLMVVAKALHKGVNNARVRAYA